METVGRIRREHLVKGKSIKEIARDLKISRNTVRKVLRSGETSFAYEREVQPRPKLGRWKTDLEAMLARNATKAARERLTLIRVFEELRALGYEGGYDAVRRYARVWAKGHAAASAEAYVPLAFAPGEAFQFDWSHDIVLIGGADDDREGGARPALSQPHDVRPSLSAREPGDGLRRARPGLRLLQGSLQARHL